MRQILIGLLTGTFWATFAQAGEYWMSSGALTWKTDGSLNVPFLSVDTSTLVYNDVDRKVWLYVVTIDDESVVKFDGFRLSFRCEQGEYAPLTFVEYEPESLQIKRTTRGESKLTYESVIPGTLFGSALKFVCAQRAGQPIEGKAFLFAKAVAADLSQLKQNAVVVAKLARLDHDKKASMPSEQAAATPR